MTREFASQDEEKPGCVDTVLGCSGFIGSAIALILLFGGSLYFFPVLGGALFTYLWITTAIICLGWGLYNGHKNSPPEGLEESRLSSSYLDVVDFPLIFIAWLPSGLLLEVLGNVSQRLGIGVLLCVGMGAVWTRRRFFPNSVIPFHPKNLALRVLSIVCPFHAIVTFCFAYFVRFYEQPSSLTWIFGVLGGVLLAVGLWARKMEFARYASSSSDRA